MNVTILIALTIAAGISKTDVDLAIDELHQKEPCFSYREDFEYVIRIRDLKRRRREWFNFTMRTLMTKEHRKNVENVCASHGIKL